MCRRVVQERHEEGASRNDLSTELRQLLRIAYPVVFTCSLCNARYFDRGVRCFEEATASPPRTPHFRVSRAADLCSFGTPLLSLIIMARSSATFLGGSALGTMTCNVTGFSLIIGLLSGMDTLCAQAHGASNFRRVGVVAQRGLLVCLAACVPIAALWCTCIDPLLVLAGQPAEISQLAARYARISAAVLPGYAAYEALKRFLSSQNVTMAPLWVALAALPAHVIVCFALREATSLGFDAIPLANVIATYLNLAGLFLYVTCFAPHNAATWPKFASLCEALRPRELVQYLGLGLSGMLMTSLEWWSFELLGLGAYSLVQQLAVWGRRIPRPPSPPPPFPRSYRAALALERHPRTSPLAIAPLSSRYRPAPSLCLLFAFPSPLSSSRRRRPSACLPGAGKLGVVPLATHNIMANVVVLSFMVSLGISIGVSVRTGALLGEGRPVMAKRLARAASALGVITSTSAACVLLVGREYVGAIFSRDPAVVRMATRLAPAVALFIAQDGVQGVAQGIARGAAKQHFGAAFVIGANYGISLPLAFYFTFVRRWGLFGLWAGLFCGYLALNAAFASLFTCMSWERASEQAVRGASDGGGDRAGAGGGERVRRGAARGAHAHKGIPTEEEHCDAIDLELDELDGNLHAYDAAGGVRGGAGVRVAAAEEAACARAKSGADADARAGGVRHCARRTESGASADSPDDGAPLRSASDARSVEMCTLDVSSPELQLRYRQVRFLSCSSAACFPAAQMRCALFCFTQLWRHELTSSRARRPARSHALRRCRVASRGHTRRRDPVVPRVVRRTPRQLEARRRRAAPTTAPVRPTREQTHRTRGRLRATPVACTLAHATRPRRRRRMSSLYSSRPTSMRRRERWLTPFARN